ncbi:MAG: GNAT family N-acetyltransferase [Casimicrobium sp.]
MATEIDLRRLEEISQNASRPDRGLMIDGWSVGLSPGLAKRSRCVNAFYPSARPFATNLAETQAAFAKADLPCIFRITPFVCDATLDARCEALGYVKFDPAVVMLLDLSQLNFNHLRSTTATFKKQDDLALAASWVAEMRGDDARETAGLAERWRLSVVEVSASFAYDEAGVRVARSVAIRENDHVGIFDVGTVTASLNRGYSSALLAAQLSDARDSGVRVAYLQVRADNPARRIYERFGFRGIYDYWYRALPDDAR